MRIGIDENFRPVSIDLSAMAAHLALQGQTRSGKSTTLYVLLGWLADNQSVAVGGCDPTGLVLSPWSSHSHGEWRSIGTGDLDAHVHSLASLVYEMDQRIAALIDLRRGVFRDKLTGFSSSYPLVVVVLEEYPALLSALEIADKTLKTSDRRLPRVQGYVRRLIQEGAKVGFRVILIAQRFDASIIGGAERSNLAVRITHRVDNADAVRMLHPDCDAELVAKIRSFPPGHGYIEQPGKPPVVFRSDSASYEEYARRVVEASSRGDGQGA